MSDAYPPIETERLRLRAPRLADAREIQRCCAPIEMAMMMLSVPHPYSVEAAEKFVGDQVEKARMGSPDRNFLAFAKTTGLLVACAGLRAEPAHRHAELGYWVAMDHWGRGYASECAERLVRYGFEEMNLHKIHAGYYTHNPASGRVLAKAGFRAEGLRSQHIWRFDRFVDVALTGLLRSDWEASRAPRGAGRSVEGGA